MKLHCSHWQHVQFCLFDAPLLQQHLPSFGNQSFTTLHGYYRAVPPSSASLHRGHIYRQQNNVTQIAPTNSPCYFVLLSSIFTSDGEISKSSIFSSTSPLIFTLKVVKFEAIFLNWICHIKHNSVKDVVCSNFGPMKQLWNFHKNGDSRKMTFVSYQILSRHYHCTPFCRA